MKSTKVEERRDVLREVKTLAQELTSMDALTDLAEKVETIRVGLAAISSVAEELPTVDDSADTKDQPMPDGHRRELPLCPRSGAPASAADGYKNGAYWLQDQATEIERMQLVEIVRGYKESPDLLACRDGDHAIQEIVRAILPPCGLPFDAAKAYWHLITPEGAEYRDTVEYVACFFHNALIEIELMAEAEAGHAADEWLNGYAKPQELEHAVRFAEEYGDSWHENPPDGCTSVHEVALYMMGGDLSRYRGHSEEGGDEGTPADPIEDFKQRCRRHQYYAATENFAEMFIRDTVEGIKSRQSQSDKVGETDDGPSWERGYPPIPLG